MTTDISPPTIHEAMARFRASLVRRASAVAWVILAIVGAQAVRAEVYDEPNFYLPMAGLVVFVILSAVARWERIISTRFAPVVLGSWMILLAMGITAVGRVPELADTAQPVLFGLAAISGLLLVWWIHAFTTVAFGAAIAYLALVLGEVDAVPDVLAPVATILVVAAATALVGLELEREMLVSATREKALSDQKADFERLYEVSATLSRAESLAEIVPYLVGTICKYLDAEVGAVLLHETTLNRLKVMSPIWVKGNTVEAEETTIEVNTTNVIAQTFRASKPIHVRRVDPGSDAHLLLRDLGVKQAIVAPLKVEGMRVGVIVIGDPTKGDFSEDQAEQLGSLAAPAGLVLSQIGRYEAQAEMTRRLEEVAQMKTDFVSTVSHELRSPLTSIIGSLDTVNRPELAPPEPTSQQLLISARRQAGRLQRLIEDLLVVSRIDRGAIPIHIETIALKEIFDEVNRVVTTVDASIEVEPPDTTVEADRDHLTRILINLVENAAKYAPDSTVELYGWQRASRGFIAVVDHGPGIPEDQRESVFERFTQLDQSDTRSRGGTGLGLSIVKSLTEVMRGSVRIESTEGGGATFVLELPLGRKS